MAKTVVLPLSIGVKDVKTSKAIKALEDAVNEKPSLPVSGSHTSGDALKSLIAMLSQLGLITDRTTP